MLDCDKTITLVKCNGEAYTMTAIAGVSWFEKAQVRVEGVGLVFANAVQIRIPAAAVPAVLPEVGDQVILGEFPQGFIAVRPADLAPYHLKKIMAVGDNRRGGLPHVALTCR